MSIGSIPVCYDEVTPKTKADENFELFKEYHSNNTEIYRMLRQFAYEQINAGATKYSCRLILDRIKWDIDKREHGDTDFKIPSYASPWYARKFLVDHPHYGDFFTLRKMPTAKKSPDGEKQVTFSVEIPVVEEKYLDELEKL